MASIYLPGMDNAEIIETVHTPRSADGSTARRTGSKCRWSSAPRRAMRSFVAVARGRRWQAIGEVRWSRGGTTSGVSSGVACDSSRGQWCASEMRSRTPARSRERHRRQRLWASPPSQPPHRAPQDHLGQAARTGRRRAPGLRAAVVDHPARTALLDLRVIDGAPTVDPLGSIRELRQGRCWC